MKKLAIAMASTAFCLSVITCLAWSVAVPVAATEESSASLAVNSQNPDEEVSDFMALKLTTLNSAMKAAAHDDFKAVREAGEELIQLSRQAAWMRMSDSRYQQDTVDFVDNAEFLIRMAKDKDVQGTSAAYSAVATSCLECHRHARRAKIAGIEGNSQKTRSISSVRTLPADGQI